MKEATIGSQSRAKVISAWPFKSSSGTTTYETQLHEDGVITCNCFTGDTQVPLLNGECLSLEKIHSTFGDREFWVFASNENGDFVPAKAKSLGITGYTKSLIQTVLDNGNIVYSTLDHSFRLRDLTYKKAERLTAEESLLSWEVKLSKVNGKFSQRYLQIKLNSRRDSMNRPIYRMVHREVLEKLEGISLVKGIATHHSDFNTMNNEPENLKKMSIHEHWMFHANLGKSNSKTGWAKAKRDPIFMQRITENNRRAGKISKEKRYDVIQAWNRKGLDYFKSSEGRLFLSNMAKKRTRDSLGQFAKEMNHRVVRTEIVNLESPVPMYCLKVEKYENFALAAGVYVHNCPGWVSRVDKATGLRNCKHCREIKYAATSILQGRGTPIFMTDSTVTKPTSQVKVIEKVVEKIVEKNVYIKLPTVEIRGTRRMLRAIPAAEITE